jgi:hypothetical protein
MRYGMTYTQQLRELLNELKLAKGKNCLIFAISERPARLEELIASNGFDVREIYLEGKENLLEMLLHWNDTTENTIYVVHGIGNQFPWVLPYINLRCSWDWESIPVGIAIHKFAS